MTATRLIPAIAISAVLAGSAALAQTADAPAQPESPNQAIEQQIENRTNDGVPTAAAPPSELNSQETNTLGEAAATAQTAPVIGSGAAMEWIGMPIAAIDGTRVGTVSEVMTDQNGAVTEVHAKVGGLFGLFARIVAIPAASIIMDRDGMLVAEMSAEQIKGAPAISG